MLFLLFVACSYPTVTHNMDLSLEFLHCIFSYYPLVKMLDRLPTGITGLNLSSVVYTCKRLCA
jgi:hypothetical protein